MWARGHFYAALLHNRSQIKMSIRSHGIQRSYTRKTIFILLSCRLHCLPMKKHFSVQLMQEANITKIEQKLVRSVIIKVSHDKRFKMKVLMDSSNIPCEDASICKKHNNEWNHVAATVRSNCTKNYCLYDISCLKPSSYK